MSLATLRAFWSIYGLMQDSSDKWTYSFAMKHQIETYLRRDKVWPDRFDESYIDDMVWEQIRDSVSAGDFASYLVHRPQPARYMQEAKSRYESCDKGLNAQPVSYLHAIERIESLAGHGDPGAMFHLGKIYSIGIAVEQDYAKAVDWYLRAIELNEVRAHCNLGWLYQSGLGVSEDKVRAFELLSFGAEQAVPVAMASIGVMLLKGEGCRADVERGFKVLEEAFEAGYSNAANCIADALFAGEAVEKDEDQAFSWLKRAAEQGDARTMAVLGHYLVTGSHGRQNVARGVGYLYDAMNLGFTSACLWLGALYEQGLGVERNLNMACMLFEMGSTQGDDECAFALERLNRGNVPPPAEFPRIN